MPTNPPDDLEQRLNKMRRLVNALAISIDALEREMLALHSPRTDGERAAQQARSREEIFLTGPMNVKEVRDPENRYIASLKERPHP